MVTERQTLDLGEQLVAEIEGDVLRNSLRVVLLAERKDGAHNTEYDNREHRADECLGRTALPAAAAHDGVDDVLNELGHDQLRSCRDKQRAICQHCQAPVATRIAHRTRQHAETQTWLSAAASSLGLLRLGRRHRGNYAGRHHSAMAFYLIVCTRGHRSPGGPNVPGMRSLKHSIT